MEHLQSRLGKLGGLVAAETVHLLLLVAVQLRFQVALRLTQDVELVV